MDDVDDLFAPVTGKPWYETLTAEQAAWVDEVVAEAEKRGQRPGTTRFCQAFEKKFGRTVAAGTVRSHFRQRLGIL